MFESTKIRQFFENFLARENSKNPDKIYLDFLKILHFHFDELINKKTSQRRVCILEKIQDFLTDSQISQKINLSQLPTQGQQILPEEGISPQTKVREIDLVNFRGFQVCGNDQLRKIDFHDKATLFFAPNGGGKTSLCEALEWCLTGSSQEFEVRKFQTDDYFQNRIKSQPRFSETKLILHDNVPIPNAAFERSFLEKNRIEKFAKLAIQQDKEFQEILGELFGLSELVEFLKEFGKDLSPTTKELESPQRAQWLIWTNFKNEKLKQEKLIQDSMVDEKKAMEELNESTNGKDYLVKDKEISDLINSSQAEIDFAGKDISVEFSAEDFRNSVTQFISLTTKWKTLEQQISDNAKNLDFENLYQAANRVLNNDFKEDKCPLCDTPLKQAGSVFRRSGVVTNPKIKTKIELNKLKKLTDWKDERKKCEESLRKYFRLIRDNWQKVQSNLKDDNWAKIGKNEMKPLIKDINFVELEAGLEGNMAAFIDACNAALEIDFALINLLEEKISEYKSKILEILNRESEIKATISRLQEDRSKLGAANNNLSAKKLIRESGEKKLKMIVEQESNAEKFSQFLNVYPTFYDSLRDFQSRLISQETSDIDRWITGFYRTLNLHDHDGEKVKAISFPKSSQEHFCIQYEHGEENICNALHTLSEGHLKTLGLSALLARAMKYNVPILVFDDAINAIDSDHRDNIALMLSGKLLESPLGQIAFGVGWERANVYLKNCQLIITSHDRFFDERIANLYPSTEHKRYVLFSGKDGIDFCERGEPGNFEAKIEKFLRPETQDIRSAIFYCRIWLEEICLKIAAVKKLNFKRPIDEIKRQITQPALEIILLGIKDNLGKTDRTDEEKAISVIAGDILNHKGSMPYFFEIINQESHHRRFDHIEISHAPTSQEVVNIFQKIQEINQRVTVTESGTIRALPANNQLQNSST